MAGHGRGLVHNQQLLTGCLLRLDLFVEVVLFADEGDREWNQLRIGGLLAVGWEDTAFLRQGRELRDGQHDVIGIGVGCALAGDSRIRLVWLRRAVRIVCVRNLAGSAGFVRLREQLGQKMPLLRLIRLELNLHQRLFADLPHIQHDCPFCPCQRTQLVQRGLLRRGKVQFVLFAGILKRHSADSRKDRKGAVDVLKQSRRR